MRLLRCISLVSLLVASSALAQNAKVSTLIPVTTPLTGSELFYVVQGGVSKNMTYSQLQQSALLLPLNNTWTGTNLWAPPNPVWATYTIQYTPIISNINNLPILSMYGNGTGNGGITTALVGAIDVPSTDVGGGWSGSTFPPEIGVAGYCRTGSQSRGCTGIFGVVTQNVEMLSSGPVAFLAGGNAVVTNFSTVQGSTVGHQYGYWEGLEADVKINNYSGGAPSGTAVGVQAEGSMQSIPTGGAYAFLAGPVNVGATLGWSVGFICTDQPMGECIQVGAAANPANVATGPSQKLTFQSYFGGTALKGSFTFDQFQNLNFDKSILSAEFVGCTGGNSIRPTLASGIGIEYCSLTAGLLVAGDGSSFDFVLQNSSYANVFTVAHGTQNMVVAGSIGVGAGTAITSSGPGGVLGNPAFVASSVTKTCGATIVVTNGVVTSC